MILSTNFKESFRVSKSAFTRNRILNFPKLVLGILSNLSRSLSIEVYDMIQTFELAHYSKQAFSWARLNLKYTAFIYLNDLLVKRFYEDDYKTYKDRILLAVDGFSLSLPNTEKLGKKFGFPANQNGDGRNPTASCISLYDILNEFVLDSSIRRFKTSERKMAEKSISRMMNLIPDKKYLLVADRGFPSVGILFYLASKSIDFVIRTQCPFLKEFDEIYKGESPDLVRTLAVDKDRLSNNKDYVEIFHKLNCQLKLRMIRVEIGKNKYEYLITNLLDDKEFTASELKEIYHKRWCIETDFKRKKILYELENFASKTSFRIKQEFYAKILILNFSNMMINDIEEDLQKEKNDTSFKINRNIAYGLIKKEIIKVFIDDLDLDIRMEYITGYLKRQYTKTKPDRVFERKPSNLRRLKFHWNQRRAY